jgi:hypothetical protein
MRSIEIFTFAVLQSALVAGLTSEAALAQTDSIPTDLRARELPR